MAEVYIERYRAWWLRVFTWRESLPIAKILALALGMACLTGLVAQVRIQTPLSPVPFTGQTFAVLAAGVLLGRYYGGVSQVLYVALGAAGVPWFNGGAAGLGQLAGPTGGYLVGFIVAALVIGYVTDAYAASRRFLPLLGLMLLVDLVFILGLGTLYLYFYLNVIMGGAVGFGAALGLGMLPFIAGDAAKAALAALMARSILPREPFNR